MACKTAQRIVNIRKTTIFAHRKIQHSQQAKSIAYKLIPERLFDILGANWRNAAVAAVIATLAAVALATSYGMYQFRERLHDQTDNNRVREQLATHDFYAHEKIVFFGDSQLALWNIRPSFGVMPIVNKGISGDWAVKAINRFDRDVLDEHPTALVLLIGTNDLGNAQPQKNTVGAIEEMIRRATAKGIRVVVCGLLPARDAQHPIDQLGSINHEYKKLAETYGAVFVDFTAPLSDERGLFRSDLTRDGLHANDAGYLLMARTLYPHLSRLVVTGGI